MTNPYGPRLDPTVPVAGQPRVNLVDGLVVTEHCVKCGVIRTSSPFGRPAALLTREMREYLLDKVAAAVDMDPGLRRLLHVTYEGSHDGPHIYYQGECSCGVLLLGVPNCRTCDGPWRRFWRRLRGW